MRSKGSWKMTLALLLFSAGSASVFAVELVAFERTHRTSLGQAQPQGLMPVFPLSLQATHSALRYCENQLLPPEALTKTASELFATVEICETTARRVLKSMPSHGHGYYVLALTEHHHGTAPAELLEISALLAPTEGWLAQRRVSFSFRENTQYAAKSADLDVLLTMQAGAEFLANHYIRDTNTRLEIADRLTVSSANNQTRFINLLRKGRVSL